MKINWTLLLIILAGSLMLLVCLCLAVFIIFDPFDLRQDLTLPQGPGSNSNGENSGLRTDPGSFETLAVLNNTDVPAADPYDLAYRLEGRSIPRQVSASAAPLQVGTREGFWVSSGRETYARLRAITDHAYFWIEEGVEYDPQGLAYLADLFENRIFPTNRNAFGSEWTPGIDGDPHIYILITNAGGEDIAGSFSSVDELNPLLDDLSDAHELIRLSADYDLTDEYLHGTLAHEFQHVIHYNLDRNEELWLEEGLSELAAHLNGFDPGNFDTHYTSQTDFLLTEWPDSTADADPNYGGSFLFMAYFYDRFGEAAVRSLAADPANGVRSLDRILAAIRATDPASGAVLTSDGLLLDFALMLYLQDGSLADGRYGMAVYPDAPRAGISDRIQQCPGGPLDYEVLPYGIDYIDIECAGDYTLAFQGDTSALLLPVEAHSGSHAFWGNRAISSAATLSHTFDLRNAEGPLTLDFWTWYDLENGYDFVYPLIQSEDGSWHRLPPDASRVGFTGQSNAGQDWIQASLDLSPYAGQVVRISFEQITDETINLDGFLIDDISIPEIGYAADFENGPAGWLANGFALVEPVLPQTFRLALIIEGPNGVRVEYLSLDGSQRLTTALNLQAGEHAVLVVANTARYTRQPAGYQIIIGP